MGTALSPASCWLGPGERHGAGTCRQGEGGTLRFPTSQPQVCRIQEHDSTRRSTLGTYPKIHHRRPLAPGQAGLRSWGGGEVGRGPTWQRRQRQCPLRRSVQRALATGLRSVAFLSAALAASPLPSLLSGFISQVFSSVPALGSESSTPCRGEAHLGVDVDSPSLTGLWGTGSGRGTCPEVGEKAPPLGEGKVRRLSGDSRRSPQLRWVGRWESAEVGGVTCPSPQPQGFQAAGREEEERGRGAWQGQRAGRRPARSAVVCWGVGGATG